MFKFFNKKNPLPFKNKFPYPYKERQFDEATLRCLEAESLYRQGQKGKAKLIWQRLAKAGSNEADHALMCYYIDKGDIAKAVRVYSGSHAYASFNKALIIYRLVQFIYDNKEGYDTSFSIKLDDFKLKGSYTALDYVTLFRVSAMKDLPEAQYNLAYIYQHECFDGYKKGEKNLYLALYWYYRGAMRRHGGCIRGLCEVYKELLPLCDADMAAKFKRAIKKLEKWMAKNPDKLGDGKMIMKHFDMHYHDKLQPYREEEHVEELVARAVSKTNRTARQEHLIDVEDNVFTFTEYKLTINKRFEAANYDARIPTYYWNLVFKGRGRVTFGTFMVPTKKHGAAMLEYAITGDFEKKLRDEIWKDPYCVLAFEKICKNSGQRIKKVDMGFIDHYAKSLVDAKVDMRTVSTERFVNIPPKKIDPPVIYSPPAKQGSSASFDLACEILFDKKNDYYYTVNGTSYAVKRDVGNPNIFYDSAGNKYYSGDDGKTITGMW